MDSSVCIHTLVDIKLSNIKFRASHGRFIITVVTFKGSFLFDSFYYFCFFTTKVIWGKKTKENHSKRDEKHAKVKNLNSFVL